MNFISTTEKPFTFHFNTNSTTETITSNITIPLEPWITFREIGHRIMTTHTIPDYAEEKLMTELRDFIEDETEKCEDDYFEDNDGKAERLKQFSAIFADIRKKQQVPDQDEKNNGESFRQVYHELIHSGFLTEPLVSLENSFSFNVREMIDCRNQAMDDMTLRQTQEMEKIIKSVGVRATEEDVNVLSVAHFEQAESGRKLWETSLHDLKESQKDEFRDWLDRVYTDFENDEQQKNWTVNRIRSVTESSLTRAFDFDKKEFERNVSMSSEDVSRTSLDESFTINLGAQLKTTHNLRLTSTNVLKICRNMSMFVGNSAVPTPQRIQTAMSLYSNSLTGLVLLVDNRVNSYTGIKKDFAGICEQSADFHFPNFEQQLENVRQNLATQTGDGRQVSLRVGDFYVTKHSNLSQVHVVFHLVSDESILSSDINSRHPIMLGLRNILKTAYISDIRTISLPLLLSFELTDNMTLQWCLKRAELVFKCVKGFMIEMASLSPISEENRTLQFVVPEGISEELFSNLASMLPSIFRLSNPLVLSEAS